MKRTLLKIKKPPYRLSRFFVGVLGATFASIFIVSSLFFAFYERTMIVYQNEEEYVTEYKKNEFPVSVDTNTERIIEDPELALFVEEHLDVPSLENGERVSWLKRAFTTLAHVSWYQNLASASHRVLIIAPGERREEVAQTAAKIMKWDSTEKQQFIDVVASSSPFIADGKFFPGEYSLPRDSSPQYVADVILNEFSKHVLERYSNDVSSQVRLNDAIVIASLLEREAYDFTDMREISGIIWNRLFADMRLQLDATLQYAKGSTSNAAWWPKVVPADKYIASPYNTYKHSGLPPAPIANPSLEAIIAALNPTQTDCMFYFHDAESQFHCTETYEDHVALLKKYYGRGK